MKVPAHQYSSTVAFYRDVIGLEAASNINPGSAGSTVFRFGDKNLWIDEVATLSQAEIWLEVLTDDLSVASDMFAANGCPRCDEIEPLPDGLSGFWISSPANIIHLVVGSGRDDDA